MSRVNVGICPKHLSDQHLIAESIEITMITGALRKDNYQIKGEVPNQFCLGKGHINFFKPKVQYLVERLNEVNNEMINRGFKPGTSIELSEFSKFAANWQPKFMDSCVVRQRVIERLTDPMKAKPGFHKYYGVPIENMDEFCNKIKQSKLYYV